MRQFFLQDTLRWDESPSLPGVQKVAYAKRAADGPEEIVGYDDRVEGNIYMYKQRKVRVTNALQNGLVGVSYDTKEEYWHRNCVPAADLEPMPEKKRRAAPKAAAEPADDAEGGGDDDADG